MPLRCRKPAEKHRYSCIGKSARRKVWKLASVWRGVRYPAASKSSALGGQRQAGNSAGAARAKASRAKLAGLRWTTIDPREGLPIREILGNSAGRGTLLDRGKQRRGRVTWSERSPPTARGRLPRSDPSRPRPDGCPQVPPESDQGCHPTAGGPPNLPFRAAPVG